MPVITIAGTMGARVSEIGTGVANQLGLDYLDHEILVDGARSLGVPVDVMVERDERCQGFGGRIAGILRNFLEQSASAGAIDPMTGTAGVDVLLSRTYTEAVSAPSSGVDDKLYIAALTAIIEGLARRGNVVIVGRGGQAILRGRPDVVHVAVNAPFEWRVANIARRDGIPPEEAGRVISEFDKQRAAYHKKFFKVDVNDPSLYDIGLNSASLGPERAMAAICALAETREAVAV
ncbi:MAG TPA: cytidylate kinase-like family protein [Dehalococcoidia bacterium]|nr:cytidylate kinase-like family protein [Dehalococcoidia bacterium]